MAPPGRKRKRLKRLQVSDLIGSHWFTRQRWRVSTHIRRLAWVFAIAFARNHITGRSGLLLESLSILRLTRGNGGATSP